MNDSIFPEDALKNGWTQEQTDIFTGPVSIRDMRNLDKKEA